MRLACVLVMLTACGDGVPALDASASVGTPLGVVRVRYDGPNRANQRVLFQAADSSIVLATHTDAAGRANAFMPDGGFVTVAVAALGGYRVFTWARVKDGDDLVVSDGNAASTPVDVLLSVPPAPDATAYRIETRCDSRDVTSAVFATVATPLRACGDATDMLFVAQGPSPQYMFLPAQHVLAGDTLAPAGPWRAGQPSSVVVSAIPGNITSIQISRSIVDRGAVVGPPIVTTPPIGAGRTVTDDALVVPDASYRIDVAGFSGEVVGFAPLHAARWGSAPAQTAIDLGAVELRPFASRPAYDRAANTATWKEGTGELPDATLLGWSWQRPEIGGNFRWLVAAPRDADPEIHLPVLPDDLAPNATASITQFASFAIVGGYDAGRASMLSWTTFQQFPANGGAGSAITQERLIISPD